MEGVQEHRSALMGTSIRTPAHMETTSAPGSNLPTSSAKTDPASGGHVCMYAQTVWQAWRVAPAPAPVTGAAACVRVCWR